MVSFCFFFFSLLACSRASISKLIQERNAPYVVGTTAKYNIFFLFFFSSLVQPRQLSNLSLFICLLTCIICMCLCVHSLNMCVRYRAKERHTMHTIHIFSIPSSWQIFFTMEFDFGALVPYEQSSYGMQLIIYLFLLAHTFVRACCLKLIFCFLFAFLLSYRKLITYIEEINK